MSNKDSLTTLLSLEGFFFTAITVSVAIARGGLFGDPKHRRPFVVSLLAVLVLALIAVGAVTAWADLFTGCGRWPSGGGARYRALALLAAIIAQPLLAFMVALAAKGKKKWPSAS